MSRAKLEQKDSHHFSMSNYWLKPKLIDIFMSLPFKIRHHSFLSKKIFPRLSHKFPSWYLSNLFACRRKGLFLLDRVLSSLCRGERERSLTCRLHVITAVTGGLSCLYLLSFTFAPGTVHTHTAHVPLWTTHLLLSASNHHWDTWALCCLLGSFKGCVISVYFFICLSARVHICNNNKQTSLAKTAQARPLPRIDFSIEVELILPPLLKNWTPFNDGWSSAIASVYERADCFVCRTE